MAVSRPMAISDPGYYLAEEPLIPARWFGNGSKDLGIHGQEVEDATFLNLHDGYTTIDGERDRKLIRYVHPERRGSFEVTVTCPKCVSTLGGPGGDSRIAEVILASTMAVGKEIERQAWTRCPWERNQNLIMTGFVHGSSRAGDPHIHGHLVFENLSKSSKGYKAIELGKNGVKVDWTRVGEVATQTQMKGLRELGYRLKREGKEYSVVGVPAEVKARFSERHEQVKRLEAEFEQKKGAALTSKAKAKLSLYDRPEKPDDRPIEDRRKEWVSRLTDMEFTTIRKLVTKAVTAVKQSRWREEARSAFDRMRGRVVETPAPEVSRGRSR